jgi:uncharacterized protein (UPF0548 family)
MFDRAKAALASWKHFDLGWVEVFPKNASLDPGTVVTVLVRHPGFWSLNGCRVVYGLGDRYPMVRALQARFRRDSAEAMRRATEGAGHT